MNNNKGSKCKTSIRDVHGKSLIGIIAGLGKKVRKCKCGKGLGFNDKTLCKKCSMM
jgi:hypothetical protein